MHIIQPAQSIHTRIMSLLGHMLASDLVTQTFRSRIAPLQLDIPEILEATDLQIEECFLALLDRDNMDWGGLPVEIMDVTLSHPTTISLSGLIALAARCVWSQSVYRLAKPLGAVDLSGVEQPLEVHDRNRLMELRNTKGIRLSWREAAMRFSDNEHRQQSTGTGLEHDEEIFGVLAGGGLWRRTISCLNMVPTLLKVHDAAGALYDPGEEFRGVLLPGEILRLRILLKITGQAFPPHEAIQAVQRVLDQRLNSQHRGGGRL